MDLTKVKLVVTDMDGTLLNSKGAVSKKFYHLYHELTKRGVHFVAASGRQYNNMVHKLNLLKEDITFIAENGGIAKYREEQIVITSLPQDKVNMLVPLLRTIKEVYPVICGNKNAYTENGQDYFIEVLKEYYTKYAVVNDLTAINNDLVFKIAVYHFESSENYIYPAVKHLENDLQVKVSGHHWVDISHPDANKGHALQLVQQRMGISPDETMVFGDYNNDLEMLTCADFSFAMANAHPNVKKIARYTTKSNDEFGVELVLEQLLKAKS